MQVFFNFNIQLMIEKKADKHHYNLFTILKITAFIANKHEKNSCRNIVFTFKKNNELLISLKNIFHTYNVYILLHYIFMFL